MAKHFARVCTTLVPLILLFPATSATQTDPTARCKYAADGPPTQIGPGLQQDSNYNFAYVSDYERDTQIYRRKICNDSKTRVRFDWKLTGLQGLCDSGGTLSNQIPEFSEPPREHGDLVFDFKKMDSRGYAFHTHQIGAVGKALFSRITGYVLVGERLIPALIQFTSEIQGKNLVYVIEVEAKQPVPIQVDWKEFSDYWTVTRPGEFENQIKKMIDDKILTSDSTVSRISIYPGKKAAWSFLASDATPVGSYSRVKVFSHEPKSTEPDLSGFAALYLPSTSKIASSLP